MAKHYNTKKKAKRKIILLRIMQIVFIMVLIISILKLYKWYKENNENKEILMDISSEVIVDDNKQSNDIDRYEINFQSLKEKNNDTTAWIKVNNTNIEYPVVKTTDNSYYLKHSFDKNDNTAGWIFADYRNTFDTTDKNMVIYGHNRKDGSMFGTLKNVLNAEWYENEENRNIIFITENEKSIYKVFSIYKIENEDYYIQTDFSNEKYSEFLNTIKNRSIKNFNEEITDEDKILTLSTCDNDNKYRVVVHAKKI